MAWLTLLLLLLSSCVRNPYNPEDVKVPPVVYVGEPFVIRHCGFDGSEFVKVIFDGKFEAGGYMGWSGECKTQTILLNTPGERTVQFEVGGMRRCETWPVSVRPHL